MSGSTRPKNRERMSQAKLNSLILPKPAEPTVIERERIEPKPILSSTLEYDTLHPEETIRDFCINIRNMLTQYQSDKDKYDRLEQEMQDLLHYIEMSSDKNANAGFKLYKRLAEVRRERRICKNEMDLLQPIYDTFYNNQVLNSLAQVQGACRTTKQSISNRGYIVRTDVLESFLEKQE